MRGLLRELGHAIYLARRSLRATPLRTVTLVFGMTVALALPVFTRVAAGTIQKALLARARATPIVVGATGNEFDLTLSSLYFRGQVTQPIPYRWRSEIEQRGYGVAVPLYVRYSTMGAPIVGTSPEYFEQRALRVAAGRLPALLGEVVVGSGVASRLDLEPGSTMLSDLTNLYNLAGSYPLLLDVVGVLAPTGGPDDDAVFCDLRTTWVLDGRLHGHPPVTQQTALNGQNLEGENLEASAAIFLFQRITDENRATFHMHGDLGEAPLTSLLVFPPDQRAHDELLGDFALEKDLQAVRPTTVVDTVLAIVLRLSELLNGYFVMVALSTVALFVLVIWLSLRLRADEMRLMATLGASRGATALLVGVEVAAMVLASGLIAAGGSWLGIALLARWLA